MKSSAACSCLIFLTAATAAASTNVLVWDERQPQQQDAYDDFLGNEIAGRLRVVDEELSVRSVALDDAEQGLSQENLEWADVLIWWGHVRHNQVTEDNANRILERIQSGKLDLIALHSAHWARPFTYAMNAGRRIPKSAWLGRQRERMSHGSWSSHHVNSLCPLMNLARRRPCSAWKSHPNACTVAVHLPWCCFPDYRPDGAASKFRVLKRDHPIAEGLDAEFSVPHTEMYNEPFHVPEPDEVIFEETWEAGERFRSGMVWKVSKGRVFYFRPGHETFEVYKQPETIQVLRNACRWLGE